MAKASSEEDNAPTPNRSRSQSNASSNGGKGSRFGMPSFGLGKKTGLGNISASKRKSFSKDKERYGDDSRQALHSDDEDDLAPPRSPVSTTSRNRSDTVLSASRSSLASESYVAPPPFRRTHTTPVRSDAQYVKALYDYTGGAADELTIRAGDVIEVKKQISTDWWVGDLGSRSGMFPAAYVEDYAPTPTTAKPALPPAARTMPPAPGAVRNGTRAMPPALSTSVPARNPAPPSPEDRWGGMTSESDFDHDHFSDADQYATASLTAEPQVPSSYKAPTNTRKAAPPPPPSRRSQSSSNLLSTSASATFLSPPQPAFARTNSGNSSHEGSPFAGSEEESDEEEIFGGRSRSATIGATPVAVPSSHSGNGFGGMSSGLGNIRLGRPVGGASATANAPDCGVCGCEDFTQNVFKPKGTCSTCFHQH
jgi:endophilin-A